MVSCFQSIRTECYQRMTCEQEWFIPNIASAILGDINDVQSLIGTAISTRDNSGLKSPPLCSFCESNCGRCFPCSADSKITYAKNGQRNLRWFSFQKPTSSHCAVKPGSGRQ